MNWLDAARKHPSVVRHRGSTVRQKAVIRRRDLASKILHLGDEAGHI
jgi:hypothetical protein